MIELISHYKFVLSLFFQKFKFFGYFSSEEEISQKIPPWRKNQVIDFCSTVLFSNIYGSFILKYPLKLESEFESILIVSNPKLKTLKNSSSNHT